MHPIDNMTEIELLEMEAEWTKLVSTLQLTTRLGPEGYKFSHSIFREAYSIAYMKGKAVIWNSDMTPQSLLSQIFENHDPDFDQVDDFLFVIYNPTYKGRTYSFANLDYTQGIVEFGMKPLQGVSEEILERFALKITLKLICAT